MSEKTETVRICDECNKETRFEVSNYIGGHPLGGWIETKEVGGSTTVVELNRIKNHDFCSVKCLLYFFGKGRVVENYPDDLEEV